MWRCIVSYNLFISYFASDAAEMQFTLADHNQRQDYLDAIDAIEYKAGTTNTAQALNMIRTQGKDFVLYPFNLEP